MGMRLSIMAEIYNCQELQSKYLSSNFLSDSEILFALLIKRVNLFYLNYVGCLVSFITDI